MFNGGYALIDADSIYFRTCCVTKNKRDIRRNIDHAMNQIKRECMTDDLYVAVKGKGNFRQEIYPKYKANRPTLAPDLKEALTYAHKYMVDKYNAVMANGMEADDLVSIWAYECMDNDKDYAIVGIDKDLLQIPGSHYNFVKQTHTEVDVDTADYNLMLQCLVGDSSDNIPGIKGIGPKKAAGILKGVPMQRRWNRVKAAYRMHNTTGAEMARTLLSMLKSFEEYETVRDKITSETHIRQPNVRVRGKRTFKTAEYLQYQNEIRDELMGVEWPFGQDPVAFYVEGGLSSRLFDLDNVIKPLLDTLQSIYNDFNDNKVYYIELHKEIVGKGNEYIRIRVGRYTEGLYSGASKTEEPSSIPQDEIKGAESEPQT